MFEIDKVFYNFDEKPNWMLSIIIAMQYVVKFAILLSLILLLARMAHISTMDKYNFISLTLFFAAVSTLAQTSKRLGAGMIFPAAISVPYYAAILFAVQHGGWGYALGMTLVGSVCQLVLIPCIKRMRIFSMACLGLVVFLVSVWLCELGVKQIFYNNQLGQLLIHAQMGTLPVKIVSDRHHMFVGIIVLVYIIICWHAKKPWLKMTSLLVGMLLGYLLSIGASISPQVTQLIHQAPFFKLPYFHLNTLHFSWRLLPYFIIAAVMSALEAIALITIYEMFNSQHYVEKPSYKRAHRCNVFSCMINMITVAFGAPPTTIVPGAISNSFLTGVLSKRIAYLYSAFLFLLSLSPKAILFLLTMPAAVNGAGLIVLGVVILRYALLIFLRENLFTRRHSISMHTKLLGTALAVGCATLLVPGSDQKTLHSVGLTNPALVVGIFTYCILFLVLIPFGKRKGVLHE